jgi:hypothetical protein
MAGIGAELPMQLQGNYAGSCPEAAIAGFHSPSRHVVTGPHELVIPSTTKAGGYRQPAREGALVGTAIAAGATRLRGVRWAAIKRTGGSDEVSGRRLD